MDWPAPHLWLTHRMRENSQVGAESWNGSLIDGMRDATGQMYMRNRYYDPASGRFTQQDPTGLGGGLNVYGFAGGDPVSYSDPFGLKPEDIIFRNAHLRALFQSLRRRSPTIDRSLTQLERNHRILIVVDSGHLGGLNPGHTDPRGHNAAGQLVIVNTYDFSHLPALSAIPAVENGGGVSYDIVIGHEVYSHLIPNGNGWNCSDGHYEPNACSVKRENVIRHELGLPDRTY